MQAGLPQGIGQGKFLQYSSLLLFHLVLMLVNFLLGIMKVEEEKYGKEYMQNIIYVLYNVE